MYLCVYNCEWRRNAVFIYPYVNISQLLGSSLLGVMYLYDKLEAERLHGRRLPNSIWKTEFAILGWSRGSCLFFQGRNWEDKEWWKAMENLQWCLSKGTAAFVCVERVGKGPSAYCLLGLEAMAAPHLGAAWPHGCSATSSSDTPSSLGLFLQLVQVQETCQSFTCGNCFSQF